MSVTFNRYLNLLEQLQAGKHKSAKELADVLGIDTRSVRRYIEELRLLGYDIHATRGPHGGYTFRGNVYLPPMNFTDNEALALSYGLLLLKASPELAKASESAFARLEPVLPQKVRDKTKALSNSVNVQAYQPIFNAPSKNLVLLSQAIQEKTCLALRYHPPDKAVTDREFDPYAVAHMIGLWFVAGYCHLRKDLRTFRVERISKLEPTNKSFEIPAGFDVIQHVGDGIARTNRGDRTEVVIDLALSLEDAQKRLPPGRVIIQPIATGVRTTAYVKDLDEVVHFLATSTFAFTIIKPKELKGALERHLQNIMKQLEVAEIP